MAARPSEITTFHPQRTGRGSAIAPGRRRSPAPSRGWAGRRKDRRRWRTRLDRPTISTPPGVMHAEARPDQHRQPETAPVEAATHPAGRWRPSHQARPAAERRCNTASAAAAQRAGNVAADQFEAPRGDDRRQRKGEDKARSFPRDNPKSFIGSALSIPIAKIAPPASADTNETIP